MGFLSLTLGILSILVGVFTVGVYGWIGALVGCAGIIVGALGRRDTEKKGAAMAGFVCSVIGTALGLVLYIACMIFMRGIAAYFYR